MSNSCSSKALAALLGVRTVDVLKILIALEVPPESTDDLLSPEVVDIVVVCHSSPARADRI